MSPRSAAALEPLVECDQALIGADAPLVLAAFAATGAARARPAPVLAAAATPAESDAWRARGAHVVSAGDDPGAAFLDRFAAPGRRVLQAGGGAGSAGAFGAALLPASPLAAAAALATGVVPDPRRTRVLALEGDPRVPFSGVDLALALLSVLAPDEPIRLVVRGDAAYELPIAVRIAACHVLAHAGVTAQFPSDGRTRAALAARGREADWRRVDPLESPQLVLDLSSVEPAIAARARPDLPAPLASAFGAPVELVALGAGTGAEELLEFAACTGDGPFRIPCVIDVPHAGRRAGACGAALERLSACGARVERAPALPRPRGAGLALGLGLPGPGAPDAHAWTGAEHDWHLASAAALAAALRHGVVAEPLAHAPASEPDAIAWPTVLAPLDGDAAAPAMALAPAAGPVRAVVLDVLGSERTAHELLELGPRLRERAGDPGALATHALHGRLAARARDRRTTAWVVVAGARFGAGLARAPHVAPALVALGVRAVLAESFAPGAAHELVEAGIVPLALASSAAARECAAGDEIEISDLPDALEPGRSIGARNLTRGRALPLKSALTPAERALLRAGGRVAQAAAQVARSAGA